MLVKFANAEVPVWKIRKGVVVAIDGHFKAEPPSLFHVLNFVGMGFTKGTVDLKIDDSFNTYEQNSGELLWLEP